MPARGTGDDSETMSVASQILSITPVPALALAAMTDVVSRRVPNQVSVLVAACGLVARVVSGDLLGSAIATALVFAVLSTCWIRGWLGGGDVKLLTACSLLVPAQAVPGLLFAVAMAGGCLATAYLLGRLPRRHVARAAPASALRRICRVEAWRMRRRAPLPYACAIVAGCIITLVTG